jgi:hypothetical protein
MTFEPTFDDLQKRSAEQPDVSGEIADVELTDIDRDLAGDADSASDQEAVAESEADAAALAGDVTADELPPYGEE